MNHEFHTLQIYVDGDYVETVPNSDMPAMLYDKLKEVVNEFYKKDANTNM